jgi:hypothetical protein
VFEVADPDVDVVGFHVGDIYDHAAVVGREVWICEHSGNTHVPEFFAGSVVPRQE